jgi:tetratricopeptide (TPR) repeat protein
MSYDLFISYSRRDNNEGRITEIVERLKSDFKVFAGRNLAPFFDQSEIIGMEDWRHKILKGIKESHLLVACLSPSYLESEYCEWEFNEYIKHEIGHGYFGNGVAPIYFIEVQGWEDKDFEKNCADWIAELRRYQQFDLRPWYYEGEKSLRDASVREHMQQLNLQLKNRIKFGELELKRLGNVDAHNPHFIGRTQELRKLRESIAYSETGILTIIHGIGGTGKTALAVEYSQAYSLEYGGGCWQVRCEGKEDLLTAIASLSAPLGLEFNAEEQRNVDYQFERVMAELHRLAMDNKPHRCLLFLDNIDNPKILEPLQTKRLPRINWLHLIITSRLGSNELGLRKDRIYIPLDELQENDAISLIESYLPGGVFSSKEEYNAASEIVNLLNYYTLAIEIVAVYLGHYAFEVSCREFLIRLKKEGLSSVEMIAEQTNQGILHGEKSLTLTFSETFKHLSENEKLVLIYATQLPPDHIALSWIKKSISETKSEFARDIEPGYPDPWENLLRRLLSLRLLQMTNITDEKNEILVVKIHRIIRELLIDHYAENAQTILEVKLRLGGQLILRSLDLSSGKVIPKSYWELDCLYRSISLWLKNGIFIMQRAASSCCSALRKYGNYISVLELSETTINSCKEQTAPGVSIIWFYNMAGSAALYLGNYLIAEENFIKAKNLLLIKEEDLNDKFDTFSNIGSLYRETNRPEKAHDYSKETLELAEENFSDNPKKLTTAMVNYGLVLQDICNLKDAIPLFQKAIDININQNEDPYIICQDLSTLANALRNADRLDEAEIKANLAYKIMKENNYDKHPIAISIYTNLACIMEDRKKFVQAKHLYKTAHKINLESFGEQSSHLSLTLNNLGINSLLRNEINEAVNILQESYKTEKKNHKPNYQKLAHRALNIAVALMLSDNVTEADRYFKSSWNHKLQMGSHDLLSARIIHIRLAFSFLRNESYDQYLGLLKSLLSLNVLIAPEINIKSSLENAIRLKIKDCPAEKIKIWELALHAINEKICNNSIKEVGFLSNIPENDLNKDW